MVLSTSESRALRKAEEVTLGQFLRMVGRRWMVLVAVLVLAFAGAFLLRVLIPPVYSATALVDVTANPDTNVPVTADTSATERDVVLSRSVAERAVQTLGTSRPPTSLAQVRSRLSVAAPRQSRVLRISYRARSAAAAAAGANAVADAYLSLRSDQSRQRLIAREGEIRVPLNRALAQINDLPRSLGVQRQFAEREADRLRGQLNYLQWTAVDGGRIVDRANPPSAATGSPASVYLVGALLVGLLLGVPAAVFADRRRTGRRP